MRHFLILASLAFVTASYAEEADFDFNGLIAKKALRDYKKAVAKDEKAQALKLKELDEAGAKAAKSTRDAFVESLKKALKQSMQAGNLDEANKISDAIKALKKGAKALKNGARPADRGKTSKKPLVQDGVYRADYGHYPWVFEYHVKGSRVSCPEVHNDDGHSEPRNWRGKLRPLGENRVAVNWVHGIVPVLEIWTITDSHILIQQWTGNDDRSKLPRHLAVIWLDKK